MLKVGLVTAVFIPEIFAKNLTKVVLPLPKSPISRLTLLYNLLYSDWTIFSVSLRLLLTYSNFI